MKSKINIATKTVSHKEAQSNFLREPSCLSALVAKKHKEPQRDSLREPSCLSALVVKKHKEAQSNFLREPSCLSAFVAKKHKEAQKSFLSEPLRLCALVAKKTKHLFFFLFLFIAVNNYGQAIRFSHVLGSSGYDDGYSAKQTFDKGYIVGGSTSSFGAGATDMYLLKTDEHGNPGRQATFGGINIDIGKCVRQTADSGYIFVGYTNSFGAGGYDVYLVKTDSLFNPYWTKTIGGADWDFGTCVEQTRDGGYIICGSTYSYGHGDQDYYLIKTNFWGDTLWTKTFGGANEDIANSVIQTTDGGYILTGTTKSMGDTLGDIYTVKTDSMGNTMWTNKSGGTYLDYGNDILESRYGGYLVVGESQSFSTTSDGVIIKIDTLGNTVGLMYQTYLPYTDYFQSITEDTFGMIAVTGRIINSSTSDIGLFILRSDWSYVNGTSFGGTNNDEIGYSVEPTNDKGFIICGKTNSFNNFLDDIYLVKADSFAIGGSADVVLQTSIQTYSSSQNSGFHIFPNPATDFVTIYSEKINEATTIKIFDVLGNELKSEKTNLKIPPSINVFELADGIYFLTISTKKSSFTQKLIVQH